MSQNRLTHPDEDMVYACPDCDKSTLRERVDGSKATIDPDAQYVCYDCQSGVNNPVERESREIDNLKEHGGSRAAKHGLAAKLEAMDPEDLSA